MKHLRNHTNYHSLILMLALALTLHAVHAVPAKGSDYHIELRSDFLENTGHWFAAHDGIQAGTSIFYYASAGVRPQNFVIDFSDK